MTDELELLFCPTCASEQLAETPPCPDGHGHGCPERVCVECGTALLLDTATYTVLAGGSGSARPDEPARHRHAA